MNRLLKYLTDGLGLDAKIFNCLSQQDESHSKLHV